MPTSCHSSLTQCPIIAFSFPSSLLGHLNETIIERQVVSNGILPSLLVFLKVRELDRDVGVDLCQGCPLVFVIVDSHCNERHIGVWWFVGFVGRGRGGGSWGGNFDRRGGRVDSVRVRVTAWSRFDRATFPGGLFLIGWFSWIIFSVFLWVVFLRFFWRIIFLRGLTVDWGRRFLESFLFELGRVAYNYGGGAFYRLEGLIRCSMKKGNRLNKFI